MKILQINCVYKNGSTGKIVQDIHEVLTNSGIESLVCYGRGPECRDPGTRKICSDFYARANKLRSMVTGLMYGGCGLSTGKLCTIIRREKPDIVHLHCINGYFVNIYRLVAWLKKNRIKTVVTQHAEFFYTAGCGYAYDCEKWKTGCGACPRRRQETKSLLLDGTARSWKKMKRAFAGFEEDCVVVSVSHWLRRRAQSAPILQQLPHKTVYNGINTDSVFYPRASADSVRESLGLGDRRMILHVTPSFRSDPDHIKGGYYVLELAKRFPELAFVVAGRNRTEGPLPENVRCIGLVQDQQALAELYSAADVTLLTSRQETFSMITAESISCGTPVVGFCAGAPEEIAPGEFSAFGPYGDVDALGRILTRMLASNRKEACGKARVRQFDRENMAKNYLEIYNTMLHK